VKWRGGIYTGVVRFKGSLSGIQGDWVGVALAQPGRKLSVCPTISPIKTLICTFLSVTYICKPVFIYLDMKWDY